MNMPWQQTADNQKPQTGKLRRVARGLKYAFNSAAIGGACTVLAYTMPVEDILPAPLYDRAAPVMQDFRAALRGYFTARKQRAEAADALYIEYRIEPALLEEARAAAAAFRGRFSNTVSSGREGAIRQFPDDWQSVCIGLGDLSGLDVNSFTVEQDAIYDTVKTLAIAPTGRALLHSGTAQDVHLCHKDLNQGENRQAGMHFHGDYNAVSYVIRMDRKTPHVLAHELRHHWQNVHNMGLLSSNSEISHRDQLIIALALEADAEAIAALVEAEIDAARQLDDEYHQASLAEIQTRLNPEAMVLLMRREYRAWYDNAALVQSYAERYHKPDGPARTSPAMAQQLSDQSYPLLGHSFNHYANYMTSALQDHSVQAGNSALAASAAAPAIPQAAVPHF